MKDDEIATKQDLKELQTRLSKDLIEMETRIVDRLTELTRDVETRLLTAFHGYGKGQAARMYPSGNNAL